MEDKFEFTFNNGDLIYITKGEDGYTVNILSDEPLMGTFTDFENLLYGIGEYVQNTVSDNIEFVKFAEELSLTLSNTLVIDEIEEILLK